MNLPADTFQWRRRWPRQLCAGVIAALCACLAAAEHDIALVNGRVIDPDTGLDALRNVAVDGDRIVAVTDQPITAKRMLDVSGLVVSPGFIDLHVHGQTNQANEYQVRDGVTTALELEAGMANVRDWLASREGNALINYGASASHATARSKAMDKYAPAWRAAHAARVPAW